MFDDPRNQEKKLENVPADASEPAVEPGAEELEDASRDWEKELENIIGGAAEAVFDSSDEEIEAELRSWGEDPDVVAEEVRSVLLDAVDRYERSGRPVRPFEPEPRPRVGNLPS